MNLVLLKYFFINCQLKSPVIIVLSCYLVFISITNASIKKCNPHLKKLLSSLYILYAGYNISKFAKPI